MFFGKPDHFNYGRVRMVRKPWPIRLKLRWINLRSKLNDLLGICAFCEWRFCRRAEAGWRYCCGKCEQEIAEYGE